MRRLIYNVFRGEPRLTNLTTVWNTEVEVGISVFRREVPSQNVLKKITTFWVSQYSWVLVVSIKIRSWYKIGKNLLPSSNGHWNNKHYIRLWWMLMNLLSTQHKTHARALPTVMKIKAPSDASHFGSIYYITFWIFLTSSNSVCISNN